VSDSVDILVIDDNDVLLEYMTDLLSQKGFTVKTTTDSIQLDGYSILRRMRDQKSLANVPVIIYTGKSFPIDEKKARNLGANSYLVKPVKGSVIVEEVKKYI
jgi:DNA-binding response OmpR family regulator